MFARKNVARQDVEFEKSNVMRSLRPSGAAELNVLYYSILYHIDLLMA
jgi:hypothetical protein